MGRADARTRFEHEVAVLSGAAVTRLSGAAVTRPSGAAVTRPSGAAVTRPSLFAQQTFFILKLDLDNLLVLHTHPGDTNGETAGSSVEFYRCFWGQATRRLAGSYRVARVSAAATALEKVVTVVGRGCVPLASQSQSHC